MWEAKEGEFHLHLKPSHFKCGDKMVVIAPIGLERKHRKLVISWACSRGPFCNEECRYSFKHKV